MHGLVLKSAIDQRIFFWILLLWCQNVAIFVSNIAVDMLPCYLSKILNICVTSEKDFVSRHKSDVGATLKAIKKYYV